MTKNEDVYIWESHDDRPQNFNFYRIYTDNPLGNSSETEVNYPLNGEVKTEGQGDSEVADVVNSCNNVLKQAASDAKTAEEKVGLCANLYSFISAIMEIGVDKKTEKFFTKVQDGLKKNIEEFLPKVESSYEKGNHAFDPDENLAPGIALLAVSGAVVGGFAYAMSSAGVDQGMMTMLLPAFIAGSARLASEMAPHSQKLAGCVYAASDLMAKTAAKGVKKAAKKAKSFVEKYTKTDSKDKGSLLP